MVTTDLDRSMKGSKRADQLYLGPTLGMTDAQQNILYVTTGGTTAIDRNITLVEVNFAGPVTIQLPTTVNVNPNLGTLVRESVTIADISGAAGTNNITILPFGSERIIGLASVTISNNYGSYTLGPFKDGGWSLLNQNPSSIGSMVVETRADIETTMIPVLTAGLITMGYASVGDGGQAYYAKVALEPTHPGKVQSADGAWWEIANPIVNAYQFGAIGDATVVYAANGDPVLSGGLLQATGTDDTNTLRNFFQYLEDTEKPGVVMPGSYRITKEFADAYLGDFDNVSVSIHFDNVVIVCDVDQTLVNQGPLFSFEDCDPISITGSVRFVGNHTKATIITGPFFGNSAFHLLHACKNVTLGRISGIGILGLMYIARFPTMAVDPAEPPVIVAYATLTFSGNPADGDTVTVGSTVYTFETGALDVPYKVKVGADAATSLANLRDAINGAPTYTVDYALGTAPHVSASAVDISATELVVSAHIDAALPISVAESSGVLLWSSATLIRGAGYTAGDTITLPGNGAWVTTPQTYTATVSGGQVTALTPSNSGLYPYEPGYTNIPGMVPLGGGTPGNALTGGTGTGLRAYFHWVDADPLTWCENLTSESFESKYCARTITVEYSLRNAVFNLIKSDFVIRPAYFYGCDNVTANIDCCHFYHAMPLLSINGTSTTNMDLRVNRRPTTEPYGVPGPMVWTIFQHQPGKVTGRIKIDADFGTIANRGGSLFGMDRNSIAGPDRIHGWGNILQVDFDVNVTGQGDENSGCLAGNLLGDNLNTAWFGERFQPTVSRLVGDTIGFVCFQDSGLINCVIGDDVYIPEGGLIFTDFFRTGNLLKVFPRRFSISPQAVFGNRTQDYVSPLSLTFPNLEAPRFAAALIKSPYVIAKSAAGHTPWTGSVAESGALATVTVPAGLPAGASVIVKAVWRFVGTAGTKTVRTRYATALTIHTNVTAANTLIYMFDGILATKTPGATGASLQFTGNTAQSGGYGTTTSDYSTFSVDTTVTQNITFTCQLANAADTAELVYYEAILNE